jgi:hypothetical protein
MASTPSQRGSVHCCFPGAQQQQMIQGAVMIDVGQNTNINSSFQTKPGQQKSTTQTASNDFAKVASLCDCTDHSSFQL